MLDSRLRTRLNAAGDTLTARLVEHIARRSGHRARRVAASARRTVKGEASAMADDDVGKTVNVQMPENEAWTPREVRLMSALSWAVGALEGADIKTGFAGEMLGEMLKTTAMQRSVKS